MRTVKITSAIALLGTCLTPVALPTMANAAVPTITDKQAICDAFLLSQDDPSVWRALVVNESMETGADEQIEGTEDDFNERADFNGPFDYTGAVTVTGPLVRTGGSPNLWGSVNFASKTYRDSIVDVQAEFERTDTYRWDCQLQERISVQVGGGNGGNNGQGSGNNGNNNGQNQQDGGNGNGNNGCGNGNGGPNGTNENCGGGNTVLRWVDRDIESGEAENTVILGLRTIATNEARPGVHYEGVNYVVNGPFVVPNTYALACISPGPKGGAWRAKAEYAGGNCSTTTFNNALTVRGNIFTPSISSNSLPGEL